MKTIEIHGSKSTMSQMNSDCHKKIYTKKEKNKTKSILELDEYRANEI